MGSGAPLISGSATRHRYSSTWPHHTSVEATALASGPTSRFQAGPPGLQGVSRCNCSISCRRLPTLAVNGSDRPTSTRAAFLGPTHGSATGASQPLDRGSGTVCQPGFASPTTSENFVFGSWSRFCSIDTAAHTDYCSYAPVALTHSPTIAISSVLLLFRGITLLSFSLHSLS